MWKLGDDATIAVAGVLTTGASLNIPAANAGVGAYVVVRLRSNFLR